MNCLPRFPIASVRMAVLVAFISLATAATGQTITTFDPPNSTYTVATAINLVGQVAGYYVDANGSQRGFLRKSNGTFTSFQAALYELGYGDANVVTDMNLRGEIAGYIQGSMTNLGFVRHRDGTIVLFSGGETTSAMTAGPVARPMCGDGTAPVSINALGQITGSFGNVSCYGFLRQSDGTVVDFLPTGSPIFGTSTSPQAINLRGQIIGNYTLFLVDNVYHGFLRQRNGSVVTFDPQGSVDTRPVSINLQGDIAGSYAYATNDGMYHGFVRTPNGTFISFDPMGSVGTQVSAINLRGQIIGYYATSDGKYHGFVRDRNGNFETFDAPGGGGGTFPADISDLGQIVGYYQDGSFTIHGFLRSAY
jgi:uncharacterized membrane protein